MAAQLPNRIFHSPVVISGADEKHQHQMIQQQQQQHPGWIPDERDSFISWLRSEFAAANAVIDAMCQHLQLTSSAPGEYDLVLNCLRQRRFNWSPVLNLQQYYSVEEVVMALQQVALKRRQMHAIGSGAGDWVDAPDSSSAPARTSKSRGGGAPEKPEPHESSKPTKNHEPENNGISRSCAKPEELGSGQPDSSNHSTSGQPEPESNCVWNRAPVNEKTLEDPLPPAAAGVKISKNFQSFENVDGRVVNVVEGLRVCENVFSASESDQLVGTLKELQGRKVELGATGYKIVGGKRIFKSRSNESIQQPAENSDELQKSSQDDTTESLPVTLQVIIDRLLDCQILPASKRPDSYIVNYLGEGGYLPPQTNNQEFDQPFCIITLQSEYTMVFGRFISMESPREFRSQFKLLLSVGSVIVLQGNSAKLARYAIPALPSKRCCFVLGKAVSKRFSRNMGFQRSSSSGGLINRPGNVVGAVQTLSPVNVSSPGFNAGNSPGAQGGPFPPLPVLSPGWSPVVPRPGRLMTGTGVFLPYNASSSGPGRPNSNSNHRSNNNYNNNKQGGAGPVLQKMNSLPASFRSQNGVNRSGKAVLEDDHHHQQQQQQQEEEETIPTSSSSSSTTADHHHTNAASSSSANSLPGSDEASSSS